MTKFDVLGYNGYREQKLTKKAKNKNRGGSFMKKILLVSTFVVGLLLAGGCAKTEAKADGKAAAAPKAAAPAKAASGVIFEFEDIKGDDNGPGVYTYPTDKVFLPGSFDLLKFAVVDGGATYNFKFTIPLDYKNEWKNAGGWDVQTYDVYMNLGTGKHKQTLNGRHVKVAEGWDKGLLVGPDKPSRMRKEIDDKNSEVMDDVSDAENLIDDMLIPDEVVIEGNTLVAKIAKDKIGDLSKLASIQCFMLSSEGYPTKTDTYNRVVNEYSAQWRFGGGNDYEGDPNVMDLLGPNDGLKNYKSDEGVAEYPTVNMIPVKK